MQQFKKNKIPNKYHPCTTEDIPVSYDSSDAMYAKDKKIAKYALRVLKSYILTYQNDFSTINALKRVKKIRFVQDDLRRYQVCKNQWRLLLQNKLKTILIYDNKENGWEPLKKYKAFLNVTQALLRDNDLNKSLMRYLPGMANLKCLDVLINSETHSNLLKELNSMPKVLSRLETFKIEWSFMDEEENSIPFRCLAENSNVEKYLTHLSIEDIEEDTYLEHLPKECKNLVFLSPNFSETSPEVHCSYLKVFENFEKLQGMKIFSDNVGSFIENFTLPPSIGHVCVNFGDDTNWSELYTELFLEEIKSFTPSKENSLIENKRLADFSEKWKSLTNLVTLKISAKHQKKEGLFAQAFMELILKSVPNLVNLELDLQLPQERNFKVDKKNPINLTQIFLACQNYSDRLEEIKLLFSSKYPLTCPSVEGINFPKLNLLQLQNNQVLDSETLENLFKIIRKPALEEPLASENIVQILLDKIVVGASQHLLPLLEVLKKSPRNSKTKLKVEVKSSTLQKIMSQNLIERMNNVLALQNVQMLVYFPVGRWRLLEFLNEIFQDVQCSEKYELELLVADEPDCDEDES